METPEHKKQEQQHTHAALGVAAQLAELGGTLEQRGVAVTWVRHGDVDVLKFSPKGPQAGVWTLTAPDGRTWEAGSPLRCVSQEQRERVPADVALARILEAANPTPDELLLQEALEALEYHRDQTRPINRTATVIAALRARLMQ